MVVSVIAAVVAVDVALAFTLAVTLALALAARARVSNHGLTAVKAIGSWPEKGPERHKSEALLGRPH